MLKYILYKDMIRARGSFLSHNSLLLPCSLRDPLSLPYSYSLKPFLLKIYATGKMKVQEFSCSSSSREHSIITLYRFISNFTVNKFKSKTIVPDKPSRSMNNLSSSGIGLPRQLTSTHGNYSFCVMENVIFGWSFNLFLIWNAAAL